MDFNPQPWQTSAETDQLIQDLFAGHHTTKEKGKRKKVKEKKRRQQEVADKPEKTESSDVRISSVQRKGKKRKHGVGSSDDNSKKMKKNLVESVDSVSNAAEMSCDFESKTTKRKKKKNKKNKNKFTLGNDITRNPGGKNFQRKDIKVKETCESVEVPVKCENVKNLKKMKGKVNSKKRKLANGNGTMEDRGSAQSVNSKTSEEQSDTKCDSPSEVSVKKRKKKKSKTDTNSESESKRFDRNRTDFQSSDGKNKKKTFNPMILSGMLTTKSESQKAASNGKKGSISGHQDGNEARKKKKKKQRNNDLEEETHEDLLPRSQSSQSLKERLMEQLNSARFRYINEQLYTHTGQEAQEMFTEDEEAFQVYHQGFQTQVNKWPVNPVDVVIRDIKQLPRNRVVADFGCGDAKLARSVPQKVHSFDLVALNDSVTACDMSHVPLDNGSVDVAVFCLSLMGTNLTDYLTEAHRVLKTGGQLKIAEVASRFQSLPQFLLKIEQFGFYQLSKDTTNKMFYIFNFKKKGKPQVKPPVLTLQPCVYKKR